MQNKILAAVFGLLTIGYILSSGEARAIADYIWLFGLTSTFLSGAVILLSVARKYWIEGNASMFLTADENGNYPIMAGRKPVNYNLVGADTPEWIAWMLTNNKTGSPPREVAQRFLKESDTVRLPEIREITSGDNAPPILLEAKKVT